MDESDVEGTAKELGWVPREDFKGDLHKWVDAETFVERGKHVMPLLRKNNETLLSNQRQLQEQVNRLTQELQARTKDFDTLQEFHNEEVTRRVAETRKELMTKLKEAKLDADVDAEIDLQDQLTQLNAASKEAEDSINGKDPHQPQAVPLTPAYQTWSAKNPWYGEDQVKSLRATAVAAEIKQENPGLMHDAFFAELDRRLEVWGKPFSERQTTKVAGSAGGSGSIGGLGNKHTYSDLPADARAVCDKFAEKHVKVGGKFKSIAEYRSHYISQLEQQGYFNQGN